jgi:hypothetical protein
LNSPLIFFIQTINPDEEEFNLFLFMLLIAGIIFISISVLLAILITVVLLFIIFGGITIGAISTSVLIGIHKKSFTAAFRSFLIVFSTFTLTIIGMGSFWFFNRIVHWWSNTKAILFGLAAGLLSGFITGILLAFLIKKLSTFLKNKLVTTKNMG